MNGHLIPLTICLVVVLGLVASPSAAGRGADETPGAMEHRGDTLTRLAEVEAAFRAEPELDDLRLAYAKLQYESGGFTAAHAALAPLLARAEPPVEALLMAARLHYLEGDYGAAERWALAVLERDPDNVPALNKLALSHFQTGAYGRCSEIPEEKRGLMRFAHLDLMMAFGDREPYEAHWGGSEASEVPFLVTDPLPMMAVELNGVGLTSLVDTGADLFVVDAGIADSLGIEIVAELMGMFAGGMEAKVGLAIADSLRLGSVVLHNVPVAVLPTAPMSIGGHTVDGIVGTNLLRQFMSTIDYPGGRLVLRDPGGRSAESFYEEHGRNIVEEVPFYLASTHFMMAPGSLNGVEGLLFHVDSGLAGEPSFGTSEQTLRYVGIPVPDLETDGQEFRGGGGMTTSATFPVSQLGLGRLSQTDLVGAYGATPPQAYRMLGFINDGTISHGFLRSYAWTLDFSRMKMVFTR